MTMTTEDRSNIGANSAEPKWQAVIARDPSADGLFVYSVKSTGVYCRPSCPSRRAKPENVAFHASPEAAERAGFRPCKRCRPDESSASEQQSSMIAEICRHIEASPEVPRLDSLAKRAGLSLFHFHRVFKAATGVTPKAYADAARSARVRDELAKSGSSVTTALYDAGFNSSGRFYAASAAMLGMNPSSYKAGGVNVAIHFAIGASSLGAILVARSERGVCAILLGDDPGALVRDLEDRFPKAELIGGDAGFEALVAKVVAFVEAPNIGLDLPLDIRGTAFQQRVWQALRQVPAGKTASYGEIARQIGAPGSVRAVAGACAANAIAVAIPCHRIVRNDGALSGYRWGVERKRALLERERTAG
jgi:AraC family transcriptional regulator of adaptative response/methylated-DNA-[protein]-cysteine methyltransferase